MLAHLKQRIVEALASVSSAALATCGPAGIQISVCPYISEDLRLFVLLPGQSEHLVNLEADSQVAMTADGWRLYGSAKQAVDGEVPASWQRQAAWQDAIVVTPLRFEFIQPDGVSVRETIDID